MISMVPRKTAICCCRKLMPAQDNRSSKPGKVELLAELAPLEPLLHS
jgi:hypothetical protein